MFGTNFDPFNQKPPGPRFDAGRVGDKQKKGESRKVLRYMFNPEIGESLKQVGETHSLFLKLVANVFLQTGLIDAAYPGLADPRQLKFHSLVMYAWGNLQFTREGAPQVLLFSAFMGTFVAVALAVLFVIAHLAMGGK
jgi:hypothetical protein